MRLIREYKLDWSLTLLKQQFLLIVVVVILTNLVWTVVFRLSNEGPRARELAQLSVSTVNLVRAALLAAEPKRRALLLRELSGREGIRISTAEQDELIVVPNKQSFLDEVRREVRQQLGQDTQIALSIDNVAGVWVSFHLDDNDDDGYWLMLPQERIVYSYAWSWTILGLLASLLALAGAALIARNIAKPLENMANFVSDIGQSNLSTLSLPISGTSEIKKLAASINSMIEDLRRNEHERAEMLAGISHDLRTPLTRLRLETEMSVPNNQIAQAMVADLNQLEAIISQFLDYARSEKEEAESWESPLAMASMIVDHRRDIGQTINLQVEHVDPQCEVLIRPKAMRRAIDNLLDNAFLYGAGEISLRIGRIEQYFEIDIADHGKGIPAEDVERVKRPFTRLESARTNATGTGLGLAIVNRVAAIHHGHLILLDNSGGGLIARLRLPLKCRNALTHESH